jgi:hypothetical protein
MDKFDQTIKNAHEAYEPKEQFVDNTMHEVMDQQMGSKKEWRGFRLWAPVAAGTVVVIALVFVLLPGSTAPSTAKNGATNNTGKTTASANEQAESDTVPSGSGNASLASDLSSVQGAMSQEGADQNSANSALNDQQQEITVPTD